MSQRFDSSLISGAHLYGSAGLGVLGSLIPATGDSGAGYTYNDLSLPADNAKEICGRITTWPVSGTLTAYEDTSFEFTAPDGAHSFAYQLYVDGVATGSPETVSLYVGSVPVTISASLGAAVASGFSAGVTSVTVIVTGIGSATATGYQASLSSAASIPATLGTAMASGFAAEISAGGEVVIACSVGSAVASGYAASISSAFSLLANTGNASASGYAAAISTGGTFSGSISDADITRIVQAVLAALNATTIPVNIKQVNSITIKGAGVTGNTWGPL